MKTIRTAKEKKLMKQCSQDMRAAPKKSVPFGMRRFRGTLPPSKATTVDQIAIRGASNRKTKITLPTMPWANKESEDDNN